MVQQITPNTRVVQNARYQEQKSEWAELLEFKGNKKSSKTTINYHHSLLPEDVRY